MQHEIAAFLRLRLGVGSAYKVQFERPVGSCGVSGTKFVKKEIDLTVFSSDKSERVGIEVKFPRNGQYPEQMFKFCQDISFLEQLVSAGFDGGFFVLAVDDPLFYSGPTGRGIYAHFRGRVPLQGVIIKPTGHQDEEVRLQGSHSILWRETPTAIRFTCVEIRRAGISLDAAGAS